MIALTPTHLTLVVAHLSLISAYRVPTLPKRSGTKGFFLENLDEVSHAYNSGQSPSDVCASYGSSLLSGSNVCHTNTDDAGTAVQVQLTCQDPKGELNIVLIGCSEFAEEKSHNAHS